MAPTITGDAAGMAKSAASASNESIFLRFNNFLNSPLGALLTVALYMGFNLPVANQLSKLDQTLSPQTHRDSPLRFILPTWYSAFTVAKYAPGKTPQNNWKHTLGKLLAPSTYTAVQLYRIKAQAEGKPNSPVPWASLLMAPSNYSSQVSKELVEKTAVGASSLTSQAGGLNVVSQTTQPHSAPGAQAAPALSAATSQNPSPQAPAAYNPVRLA